MRIGSFILGFILGTLFGTAIGQFIWNKLTEYLQTRIAG
jgi:uncharacterized protein YneF (UPF0154 family)